LVVVDTLFWLFVDNLLGWTGLPHYTVGRHTTTVVVYGTTGRYLCISVSVWL